MYKFLLSIYLQKKDTDYIKTCFLRSDYILDIQNRYKQVEINTIAVGSIIMGPNINKLHKKIHENIHISQSDKNFINYLQKLKEIYEDRNNLKSTVIAMIDDNTTVYSNHYLEKAMLIYLGIESKIQIIYCKLSDLDMKDGNVLYKNNIVSVVYYRYYYNYNQFTDIDKELRRNIESCNVINVPSIEFQIINSKYFQVILSDKSILRKYTEHYEEIYEYFTSFSSDKDKYNDNEWILKDMGEGGVALDICNSGLVFMKKIRSKALLNSFFGEEEMNYFISEIGIFGSIIAIDNKIIHNEESGYIVRTKYENSNDKGVSTDKMGLDSLELVD